MSHRDTNQLSQVVVVVVAGAILALVLGRSPSSGLQRDHYPVPVEAGQSEQKRTVGRIVAGVLRCVFEFSEDLAPHDMLAFESSDAVLAWGHCAHHDDAS